MNKEELLKLLPNHAFYGHVVIGKDANGEEDGFHFPLIKADVEYWLKSLEDDFNITAYVDLGTVIIGISQMDWLIQNNEYDGSMGDLT